MYDVLNLGKILQNYPNVSSKLIEVRRNGTRIFKPVVLSCGVSQLVGTLTITAQIINGIWNCTTFCVKTAKMIWINRKIVHLTSDLGSNNNTIQQLKCYLNGIKAERYNTIQDIKQNSRRFVGGGLSLLPFIGLFASGAYLKASNPMLSSSSSYNKAIEALAEDLIGGLPFPFGFVIKKAFYPLALVPLNLYYSITNTCDFEDKTLDAKKEKIEVDRGDGKQHHISCEYILNEQNDKSEANKTMVLFHGNGMIGPEMNYEAHFYKTLGWNVLMVTMGGYPGSDSWTITSEISSIQDASAVLKFLENKKVETIGVHGLSIGGTLAMHAAQLSDKVKIAVLDKTITNARDVAVNLEKNNGGFTSRLPSAMIRGIVATGFPIGRQVPGVLGKEGRPYLSDGCDNIRKAANYGGILVSIGGKRDNMMGRNKDAETQLFKTNFSEDIYKAHFEKSKNLKNSIYQIESQGHASMNYKGMEAVRKGLEHLCG